MVFQSLSDKTGGLKRLDSTVAQRGPVFGLLRHRCGITWKNADSSNALGQQNHCVVTMEKQ
jgi:hypothetical protein